MNNLFEAQERVSSVNVVINSFKELLLEKKLVPGQRIPSEMEIANGLGVSRGTVREALKILSAFGIVDIKVGNGSYIAQEAKDVAIDPLLFSLLLVDFEIEALSEFRRLIEFDIVQLIFKHKDKNLAERESIEQNFLQLKQMSNSTPGSYNADQFFQNDLKFHRLLGEAAKNPIAKRVYDFILDLLSYTIKLSHQHQEMGALALKTHRKIVDAIKQSDIDLAYEAINHSVDVWQDSQTESN
jgi:GntR family transcriptional repressor for pyruvate dehydrogenase complex